MHPLDPLTVSLLAHRSFRVVRDPDDAPIRHWPSSDGAPDDDGVDVWCEPGVVHVDGAVDVATIGSFAMALRRCDADPSVYALDLSGVRFFSAAGVGAIVQAGWTRRPHVIVIASEPVRRVLTMCDLGVVLDRHGWVDATTH